MRYPVGHRERSRARILRAAAELFRGRGIAATGVDRVMARAGLTAGGFYAHFRSKEALVADAVDTAAAASGQRWYGRFDQLRGRAWAEALVESYLSPAHRDDRAGGCILPSLGGEIARTGRPARLRFEQRLRGFFDLVAVRTGSELAVARPQIIAGVALCVGGLFLSRAAASPALSLEILSAARAGAERLLGLEPQPTQRKSARVRRTSRARPTRANGRKPSGKPHE